MCREYLDKKFIPTTNLSNRQKSFESTKIFYLNKNLCLACAQGLILTKTLKTLLEFCSSFGTSVLSAMPLSLKVNSYAQVTSLTT